MQVRLFGELEAEHAGVPVPVRGAKQRALLALLALRAGQPVSADRLIDMLWADGQAAHPANALQAQIGQLRRTFGPAAILTTEAGYALAAGPDDVDVIRFEQLVARAAGWPRRARPRTRQPPWAKRSGCGAGSRWPTSPMRAFLMPNGPGSTSWSWWRSNPAPELTWCWAATASSPPDWRLVPGAPAARAPVGTAHPGAVPGRAPGRGPAGLHRSP